jgi:hypothetical protein
MFLIFDLANDADFHGRPSDPFEGSSDNFPQPCYDVDQEMSGKLGDRTRSSRPAQPQTERGTVLLSSFEGGRVVLIPVNVSDALRA